MEKLSLEQLSQAERQLQQIYCEFTLPLLKGEFEISPCPQTRVYSKGGIFTVPGEHKVTSENHNIVVDTSKEFYDSLLHNMVSQGVACLLVWGSNICPVVLSSMFIHEEKTLLCFTRIKINEQVREG